jgi:RNA polymerase sigma-70 factor (ECF subfamily)
VAVHASAAKYAETDWAEIVALYDQLLRLQPTPVVALNRALAVGELSGPQAALEEIEPLGERLADYHLYHAARAELLRRVGRSEEALVADRRALELTDNPAEQELLRARVASADREQPS